MRAGACFFREKKISFSRNFFKNSNESEIYDTILHEIAHALQYYSYRLNNYRCKPHGPAFKNFYRRLRIIHLNPFLEDQKELGDQYKEVKKQIEKQDQFAWMNRAASDKNT